MIAEIWDSARDRIGYAQFRSAVLVWVFYWIATVDVGKFDSKEIDFIARKADEILYVQVVFEIPENTHETDNLLHIKDNYKKVLITGKYYEQTEIDGIEVMYVVDWLLQ